MQDEVGQAPHFRNGRKDFTRVPLDFLLRAHQTFLANYTKTLQEPLRRGRIEGETSEIEEEWERGVVADIGGSGGLSTEKQIQGGMSWETRYSGVKIEVAGTWQE